MKNLFFLLLISTFGLLSGCGYNNGITEVQRIAELRWKSDGSGLYGSIFKTTYSDVQTLVPIPAFTVCRFDATGSLSQQYQADQSASSDYSYSVFISPDNNQALTQLGSDLYRIDFATGSYKKLVQLFHLLTASPDLRFVVGTFSPDGRRTKTITVLDLSGTSVRTVVEFDTTDLAKKSGIWLSGATFGLTFADSATSHITIYDTTGAVVRTIGAAQLAFHNAKYYSSTNTLYFLSHSGNTSDNSIEKIDLTSGARTSVFVTPVENFDLTADEQFLVYNSYIFNADSSSTLKLIIVNVATGQSKELASDINNLCEFSPAGDKIAYVRMRDLNYAEVKVITATRP